MSLARFYFPKLSVSSRGICAYGAQPMSVHAVDALKSIGIKAPNHKSRQVTTADVTRADVILVMTDEHLKFLNDLFPEAREKTHKISANGDVQDPAGQDLNEYLKCMTTLSFLLTTWFGK